MAGAVVIAVACSWITAGGAGADLPNGRGWELASPSDKNGGDVIPMSNRTRAAADGSAVNFSSLVGFGNVQGLTIGAEYIAERTGTQGTSGWETHGISPAQRPLPQVGALFGFDPSYDGDMSADLSSGVFRAYQPLTDAPDVATYLNLYVRRDLRTPGPGFYQLITDPGFAIQPVPNPFFARPTLAGASSDFSHVIFESLWSLDRETSSGSPHLYEWAHGTLRLAGVLPDGTAAPSSQAGQGARSAAPVSHMISADGSRIFFQDTSTGSIYMRVDGTTTVQLNGSERTDCADRDPCSGALEPDPSGPQPGTLWDASVDGTRIFFSTSEQLVDGDRDASDDYYMYDVNAPAGHHLTLVSADADPGTADSGVGAIGASADGHYFYFIMSGQLTPGDVPVGFALYTWHDGTIKFIGAFSDLFDYGVNIRQYPWVLNRSVTMARVSEDGSHLMFTATSDGGLRGVNGFTSFDHGTACGGIGCREVYVYDANNGQLRCASCAPSGAVPTGDVQVNVKVDGYASDVSMTSHINHALSSDGRWAFFSSPDALVPEDVNGRIDAYEYDSVTGRVSLLSSGRSSDDSYFLDASASGRDAFFVTRQQLVGWDRDGSYDLYDARVGGGFPEPAVPLPACSGDACQGGVPGQAAPDLAASSGFAGKGDAAGKLKRHARHKRCKHGTRRVVKRGRVRCVRTKAHKGRRAARSRQKEGGGR